MPARWQQWMQHDIDAWQGSANIAALSDAAYRAVHSLIQAMFQSDDCALPADDKELSKASRMYTRWPECREEVMDYFRDRTPDGKITHRVVFGKWSEAREMFEKRQKGALKTNSARTAHAQRSDCDTHSERTPPDITEYNSTVQNKEDLKPLASTAIAVPASPPAFTFHLVKGKTHIVTEADIALWTQAYPAVDVRQELRRVLAWLDSHPDKRSATAPGNKKRINTWLAKEQDKGGRNGSSGNGQFKNRTERNLEALENARRHDQETADGTGGDSAGTPFGRLLDDVFSRAPGLQRGRLEGGNGGSVLEGTRAGTPNLPESGNGHVSGTEGSEQAVRAGPDG